MSLRDLGSWLLENSSFAKRYEAVVADSVCRELGDRFVPEAEWLGLVHEWSYLLFAASVLAAAPEGPCQAAALRVAQACLADPDTPEHRRDGAALVLDTLANHPTISLAVTRNLLRAHPETRLPMPARIDWMRRSIDDSVTLTNGEVLRVNHFQSRFWRHVSTSDWVSLSAPTSAGKSFIMARWIGDQIRLKQDAVIVYLVPTRALIQQVEKDLRAVLQGEGFGSVNVSSIPLARSLSRAKASVFVLTQERLHILLGDVPDLIVDVLVVDEAHKVGDQQRGVLLQHVVERVSQANASVRVVFASPMTSNPESLLADASLDTKTDSFTSEDVMVSQNLLWVSQVSGHPKRWSVAACLSDKQLALGTLTLPSNPSSSIKRLSFVAFAIGGVRPGNVVYVNGAAEAEKVALQLYDLCGPSARIVDPEIGDLVDLARRTVHKEFQLATFLSRGIAFHYGNMPLLIRSEIEELFSRNIIKYLVCTSTLIEGVNMSCRSIFLRGPRKGQGRPMSAEDFWNLAGRAGRLGREFQGNVVCVDALRKGVWGEGGPPRTRARYAIKRTTDLVLQDRERLLKYIDDGASPEVSKEDTDLQYVFGYLVAIHGRYGSVRQAPWARRYGDEELELISNAIAEKAQEMKTPPSVVDRNPGVNPVAMDGLLRYFREREKPVEELVPLSPSDEGAHSSYTAIFVRLSKYKVAQLGHSSAGSALFALTVVQWMRGFPLARLISERVRYNKRKKREVATAIVIRSVMEEVERIARFEAPKALACYRDILNVHLGDIGRSDLQERLPELSVLLELGVGQLTQVSMIGLGLSRTTAIDLSDLIAADSLSEIEVLSWIDENRSLWEGANLPALVKREIAELLSSGRA